PVDVRVLDALGDRADQRDTETADRSLLHAEAVVGHTDSRERVVWTRRVLVGERDRAGLDREGEIHGRFGVGPVAMHDRVREQLLDEQGQPQTRLARYAARRADVGDELRYSGQGISTGREGPVVVSGIRVV